jgi:putative PEP-CTERM system TPR-repeat lipoprotein
MISIKKTGWLSRSVFLISLLVIVTACAKGTNEEELMGRAKAYLDSRDINAATLELKNILRSNANNAEARYLLGVISLTQGDMKSAQKEMRRAMDAGWNEAVVQLALAEIMYRQGYFQKVIDDVPIKDKYPDRVKADLIGLWALSEAGLGKWDDAEQTIKTGDAITGAGDSLWLLQSKIRLQIYNKALPAVSQILRHALEVHPDSQDLWLISAGLAEEDGELEKAKEALQKVINLDPPNNVTAWGRQARLAQAQIWLQQDDFVKAESAIAPVLMAYPGDPLANYFAALAAFKQGKDELTEERLLAALKVMPEHHPSLLLFGALDYTRGDYVKAAYYLEKASAIQPEDVAAQILLGRTYLMLEQYDEAENRLKYASSKVDDNAELLALVGLSRFRGGDKQAGILELEKAAAAAPGNIAIRNELAQAYMSAGETGSAIKELESMLEAEDQPHRTEAMLILAYVRAGEYNRALEHAVNLSKQIPDNSLVKGFVGFVHEAKQDFLLARDSYQAALDIDKTNSFALIGMARLDLHAGKVDAARNRYESVLKTDQNNPQALFGLAKIIGQEGKVDEAVRLVEKARTENPGALDPRLFLAEYYLKTNAPVEALTVMQEAFEFAPADSRVLALLGRAQLGANRGDKALITLKALVRQEPKWADGYYYLAQAQVFSGDLQTAKKSLTKALQLDSALIRARLALGNVELRSGNIKGALKIAQDLQKSEASEVSGYLLEGDIFMSSKKPSQASQAYQKAFERSPSSDTVLKLYGSIKSTGSSEKALRSLEKWLDENPKDGIVRQIVANAYLLNGNVERATAEYEKVLELYPNSVVALNNLAWLFSQDNNEKQQALGFARRAHELAPDSVAILDTYGWLLVETGSLEQGLVLLSKAARASKDESIHYHLAVALARTGETWNAVEALKRLLNSGKTFPEKDKAKALLQKLQ